MEHEDEYLLEELSPGDGDEAAHVGHHVDVRALLEAARAQGGVQAVRHRDAVLLGVHGPLRNKMINRQYISSRQRHKGN